MANFTGSPRTEILDQNIVSLRVPRRPPEGTNVDEEQLPTLADERPYAPFLERGEHLGHDDGVVLVAPMGQQFGQDGSDEDLGPTRAAREVAAPDTDRRRLQTRAAARHAGRDPPGEPNRAGATPGRRKGDALFEFQAPAVAAPPPSSPQMQEPVVGATGNGDGGQIEGPKHIDRIEEGVFVEEEGLGVRQRVFKEVGVLERGSVDTASSKGEPTGGIEPEKRPAYRYPDAVPERVSRQVSEAMFLLERDPGIETGVAGCSGSDRAYEVTHLTRTDDGRIWHGGARRAKDDRDIGLRAVPLSHRGEPETQGAAVGRVDQGSPEGVRAPADENQNPSLQGVSDSPITSASARNPMHIPFVASEMLRRPNRLRRTFEGRVAAGMARV